MVERPLISILNRSLLGHKLGHDRRLEAHSVVRVHTTYTEADDDERYIG